MEEKFKKMSIPGNFLRDNSFMNPNKELNSVPTKLYVALKRLYNMLDHPLNDRYLSLERDIKEALKSYENSVYNETI